MFTSIVYAQTAGFTDSAQQIYSLEQLMTVGIAILLLIAIILTVVFVLWGGFLLVISGGDEHKVSPAINMIRYSAIGLLLMFVIILVIPALSSAVGFEAVGQKFKPGTIFQTMRCVADRVFGKTDESCFTVAAEGSSTSSGSSLNFGSSTTPTGNSPNGVGTWTENL
ncbi:MAG: hypothetical protein WC753_03850 [Candidatus Gracilibacteria bacterium]